MERQQAFVCYPSLPTVHPTHPFAPAAGQANLIWHPGIRDLSSIVTLSGTNIENHTWNLYNPDVHANKADEMAGLGQGVCVRVCVCKNPVALYFFHMVYI